MTADLPPIHPCSDLPAIRVLLAAAQDKRDTLDLVADLRREPSDGELAKAKPKEHTGIGGSIPKTRLHFCPTPTSRFWETRLTLAVNRAQWLK